MLLSLKVVKTVHYPLLLKEGKTVHIYPLLLKVCQSSSLSFVIERRLNSILCYFIIELESSQNISLSSVIVLLFGRVLFGSE